MPLDQFAARLLQAALAPARIAQIVRRIVGDEFDVGPVDVGPGGIASATARGRLCRVAASPCPDDPCQLRVRIAVALAVKVFLGIQVTGFLAHATVTLSLHVNPCTPLGIAVTVSEPSAADVSLRLVVPKATRRLLIAVVGVEAMLNRYVCEFVRDAVGSPQAQRYLCIDLAEVIEQAWDRGIFGSGCPEEERANEGSGSAA
jgi:hypothetical protein